MTLRSPNISRVVGALVSSSPVFVQKDGGAVFVTFSTRILSM